MRSLGLKDEHELQSYFIQRIEKYLQDSGWYIGAMSGQKIQGRSIIGWDEILEGGLAAGATVMSWRGVAGGIAANDRAAAQDRPVQTEVWELQLGKTAAELPDAFADYACGTNGGPPSTPLKGFADFMRCRPERSGLREVYFRYDDELEYCAKANDLTMEVEKYSGTKVYGYPIVASALFAGNGTLTALRIVSDPRDTSRRREDAYSLRNFLTARFGREGWNCTDGQPEDGEGPVGRTFIKQHCTKSVEGGRLLVYGDISRTALVRHALQRFTMHQAHGTAALEARQRRAIAHH